jgi:hypothetical protein
MRLVIASPLSRIAKHRQPGRARCTDDVLRHATSDPNMSRTPHSGRAASIAGMVMHRLLPPVAAVTAVGLAVPVATAARNPTLATAVGRYRHEVRGHPAQATLARLAHDRGLVAAVRSGSDARVRAYVQAKFRPVWYHWHVSRLRISRGATTIVETGVPFVLPGPQTALRDAHGRAAATLQISIQDVIGYVRLNKRLNRIDTVVRGRGARAVRTSLPAALHVRLPNSGTTTVAGRRYRVSSFRATGWRGEPLTIWTLG